MLIPCGDGTYRSGLRDVIMIYQFAKTDAYYPAIYVEKRMAAVHAHASEKPGLVRLESSIVWSKPFDSLQNAQEYVRTHLMPMCRIGEQNVAIDKAVDWSGQQNDYIVVEDWLSESGPDGFKSAVQIQ